MTYQPPSVGPAGLTIPSYQDILDDNIAQFLSIFGANQYVGNDSAIYQLLSILSLKQSDTCEALQYVYNNTSPLTAIGAGLDRIVKINGIARLPYTYSTAALTLIGTPGTVINNGEAEDVNGNLWRLPTSVTITGSGFAIVTGTCTTAGNVTAEPDTITIIATPVGGWTSVTNAGAAVPGTPVETDSQLRARQAISVAAPSLTRLAGTIADLLALAGVTRINVLENPTGGIDGYGNPPHSLTCVVDGTATNLAVATVIYNNRGIGCLTNGDVSGSPISETVNQVVNDPNTGYPMTINFLTPVYVPVYVLVDVHLLAGGTSASLTAIHDAIVNYLNALQIGELVTLSALYAVAMSVTPNLDTPQFSIRLLEMGTNPSALGTSDLTMLFYQVSQGLSGNVSVVSV